MEISFNNSSVRTTIPKEFEERIKHMNLISLRKYACQKVASLPDWYIYCVGCKGLDSCSAGKRVVDILEAQTKPLDSIFEKAIKNRDPIQWLLDNGYYSSRGSAINNLNRWKREQGMKNQIEKFNDRMAKTNAVMSKGKISQDEKFTEALKQSDPIGWLVDQGYYSDRKWARNKLSEWKRKKERGITTKPYEVTISKKKQEIQNLLNSASDINSLVINYVKSSKPELFIISLASKAAEWGSKERYKDIIGIKKFSEVSRILNIKRFTKLTVKEFLEQYSQSDFVELHKDAVANALKGRPPKAISATTENVEDDEEYEDDEVSLEDFLNEMEDPEDDEEAAKEDTKEEQISITQTEVRNDSGRYHWEKTDQLFLGFKVKIDELNKKKSDLLNQINMIDEDISKLTQAAMIIGYTFE